jgi:hypothetical protein
MVLEIYRIISLVGLVMLPTVIVASVLVVYFEWRRRLVRRVGAERDTPDHFDKAA